MRERRVAFLDQGLISTVQMSVGYTMFFLFSANSSNRSTSPVAGVPFSYYYYQEGYSWAIYRCRPDSREPAATLAPTPITSAPTQNQTASPVHQSQDPRRLSHAWYHWWYYTYYPHFTQNCDSHDGCSNNDTFCGNNGWCDTCAECHYCHDGVDGTCGPQCSPLYEGSCGAGESTTANRTAGWKRFGADPNDRLSWDQAEAACVSHGRGERPAGRAELLAK